MRNLLASSRALPLCLALAVLLALPALASGWFLDDYLYLARLAREHNDANVLAMGGRIVASGLADEIVALWLKTPFEGGRHQRRIEQIADAERQS